MFKQAAVTGQPSKFNSESLCSPAMQRKYNPHHHLWEQNQNTNQHKDNG